jgi:HEPN domain-containing protein
MADKVQYWLDLCDEDKTVADLLLKGGKYLQTGFFCHLIAEKALKAVIASNTAEAPPKIHDLHKLAKYGKLYNDLSERQLSLFKELMPLHVDGRYPEYKANIAKTLTAEKCAKILEETEDFLCWTKKRLGK